MSRIRLHYENERVVFQKQLVSDVLPPIREFVKQLPFKPEDELTGVIPNLFRNELEYVKQEELNHNVPRLAVLAAIDAAIPNARHSRLDVKREWITLTPEEERRLDQHDYKFVKIRNRFLDVMRSMNPLTIDQLNDYIWTTSAI